MEEMRIVWAVAGVTVAIVVMATILWFYKWKH